MSFEELLVLVCTTLGGALALILKRKSADIMAYLRIRLEDRPLRRYLIAKREIYTLMVELRTRMNAERAYVFMFHNGDKFGRLSVYKASCFSEAVKEGASKERTNLQKMDAADIGDLIELCYDDPKTPVGVYNVYKPEQATASGRTKRVRPVYYLRVADMDEGFGKGLLIALNIYCAYLAPVICAKQEVGFVLVGCGTCGNPSIENLTDHQLTCTHDRMTTKPLEVANAAANVGYELQRALGYKSGRRLVTDRVRMIDGG